MWYDEAMKQPNLVLVRHGESLWNMKKIFTGWVDIGLSEQGKREAARVGKLLKKNGFSFERSFSSVLKRSIKTLWVALEEADMMCLPIEYSWRLNERHYGALQGKSKLAIEKKFGHEQFMTWRRGYSERPPQATEIDRKGEISPELCGLKVSGVPNGESLKDTVRRVIPFWMSSIRPALRRGEKVLVVAHGNSLRALVKHIEGISDKEISNFEFPTGVPLCYDIAAGKVQRRYFLTK